MVEITDIFYGVDFDSTRSITPMKLGIDYGNIIQDYAQHKQTHVEICHMS